MKVWLGKNSNKFENLSDSVSDNGMLLDLLFEKLGLEEVEIEKHTKLIKKRSKKWVIYHT